MCTHAANETFTFYKSVISDVTTKDFLRKKNTFQQLQLLSSKCHFHILSTKAHSGVNETLDAYLLGSELEILASNGETNRRHC